MICSKHTHTHTLRTHIVPDPVEEDTNTTNQPRETEQETEGEVMDRNAFRTHAHSIFKWIQMYKRIENRDTYILCVFHSIGLEWMCIQCCVHSVFRTAKREKNLNCSTHRAKMNEYGICGKRNSQKWKIGRDSQRRSVCVGQRWHRNETGRGRSSENERDRDVRRTYAIVRSIHRSKMIIYIYILRSVKRIMF